MHGKILSASIVFVLMVTSMAFAQQKALPGGVEDPLFWIKSKNQGEDYQLENLTKAKGRISQKSQHGTYFNFNPSISFDATQDSIVLPLGIDSKKKQTVFLAYMVRDSIKEQFLWTISDLEKTIAVATNKRLADLKRYSYKTYQEKFKPRKANIYIFQQNLTDSIAKLSTLIIGKTSRPKELPPKEFQGSISEIIVYNRVLSAKETQKVMSYLAIKYGISLSQYEIKNYLNSRNEIIWDINKHKGFDASITAVGRDDNSGLLQLKSSNMFDKDLLTIELKRKSNEIPNNYFTFWSDNGKNLLIKKQEQGEPIGIPREWQLDFSYQDDLTLDWTFNPAFISGTVPNDTYYWLLVDYSGKGAYEEDDSEYIRLASTMSKEKLALTDFNWDKQKTGTVKFKLKVAPEMFSRVWISEASCGVQGSGQLRYTIEGGEAPFTIAVKKGGSDVVVKEWNQTARSTTGVQLSSGTYDYVVVDKKGNQYSETIFVADKDGTFSTLQANYILTDGNALILDAGKDLPAGSYKYEWYYDGNLIDNNSTIRIDTPGDYELRIINAQDCKTSKKITVTSDGKTVTNSSIIFLYPNPTSDGKFAVEMRFPKKTNASIRVYSTTGLLLKESQYNQIDTYVHEDSIEGVSGTYLVEVISDFSAKAFKVILK